MKRLLKALIPRIERSSALCSIINLLFGRSRRKIKGDGNAINALSSGLRQRCSINVTGSDNQITFGTGMYSDIQIVVAGDHNKIFIADNAIWRETMIFIAGSNCELTFGEKSIITRTQFCMEDQGSTIICGDDVQIGGFLRIGRFITETVKCTIASLEGCAVKIGGGARISEGANIRNSDSHAILDADGRRTNHARNVEIGRHVWICPHAAILKGSHLPENSVVGMRAMVSGKYEGTGLLIAGNPAKAVRENINWSIER